MTRACTGIGSFQPSDRMLAWRASGSSEKENSSDIRARRLSGGLGRCNAHATVAAVPAIRREDVERVVALARLSMSEEELSRMARELDAVLGYVALLERVDTRGVPPTAHVVPLATPLRADEPQEPMDVALALANAPESDGASFVVPKVIEAEEAG
jgi:aspartyl-tRNA(Asn)/glutamyl-tRNA(Gln) amidotransferase subunit C